MNIDVLIPHSECSVTEEMELFTSTQYKMSGSTPDISRVKGGSQAREKVLFVVVMLKEPIAERRPVNKRIVH